MTNTVVPSPKSQLDAYLRAARAGTGMGTITVLDTAALWLGYKHRVGDIVRDRDGRHLGRIDAIFNSVTARVTWLDTGWREEVPLSELVIVKEK